MSRRFLAVLMIIGLFALLPKASFAYTSNICVSGGTQCVPSEVGQFMAGITKECGNSGTCTLNDIMMVVANVGNYAVGIVGVIVLLMYTVGGFNYLLGGAMPERVKKGKDMIKISTIGLFIVFFAYVGINSLTNVLRGGSIISTNDAGVCVGKVDDSSCGDNEICRSEACVTRCSTRAGFECVYYNPGDGEDIGQVGCGSGECPDQGFCCEVNPEPKNVSVPEDAPNVSQ